jgi:hypothetical protein
MTFEEIVDQALAMLQRRGRVAADEDMKVLVWTGGTASPPTHATAPERAPCTYTPPYFAEKILTSRSALEGEQKQVTVLSRISRARWSCWPTGARRGASGKRSQDVSASRTVWTPRTWR